MDRVPHQYGVDLAKKALENKGWTVKELPKSKFTFICEKDGERLIVKVLARKLENADGQKNPSYNLKFDDPEKDIKDFETTYSAKACWMAVQFDGQNYSIYFDFIEHLKRDNKLLNFIDVNDFESKQPFDHGKHHFKLN